MRRKIHKCLSFLLAAVLLASLAAPAALAAEGGDTVFVRTAEDLVQLAENCTLDSWSQGRIVRLEADIDLSGTDFTPIPTFGGTFEGQGHTISGLSITGSGNVRGLFRYIQPSGVVRDLSVEGRVDPSDRKNTLGGIAGSNRGLLAGCTFHGTVRGADSIGGLVGINESSGQIVNCTFSGAVTGEHYAGGIAGQNYGAVIQCRNSGSINTTEVDAELGSGCHQPGTAERGGKRAGMHRYRRRRRVFLWYHPELHQFRQRGAMTTWATTSAASWGGSPDIWTAVPTPATFWAGRTWAASPVSWSRKCGCSMTRGRWGSCWMPWTVWGICWTRRSRICGALPTLCRTRMDAISARTDEAREAVGDLGGLRRGLDQREYRGAQQPHGPDLLAHRPAGADSG